ncbi:MAG: hypothetical protein OXG39_16385 [Chloroflexi bacterium]|nr:hypothetical protein [Chloroflexota bacterium]
MGDKLATEVKNEHEERLEIDPEEKFYIDDTPENIARAMFGMKPKDDPAEPEEKPP